MEPQQYNSFYLSKKKLWMSVSASAISVAVGIWAVLTESGANRWVFGFVVVFSSGITILLVRQLMNAGNEPFLILTTDSLILNYSNKQSVIPKSDVVVAKIIKQNVGRGAKVSHIAVQLTEQGYQNHIEQQSGSVELLAGVSENFFPDFKNAVTIPNTIKESSEDVINAINQWRAS